MLPHNWSKSWTVIQAPPIIPPQNIVMAYTYPLPKPVGSGISSAEVTELNTKVTELQSKIDAIPETIVVASVDDLPDPTQLKSGVTARVLSTGRQYLATGAKDGTATSWEG